MKARILMTGSMLFFLAVTGSAMKAQDRRVDQNSQDRYRQDQDRRDQNYQDRDHSRFDDHDRQVSRDWYNQHRNRPPAGLRDRDRLRPEYESRLREGYVLDRDMRRMVYPVPTDYYRRLPPPPRGYRYVFIGGHLVLIDGGY